MGLNGMKKRMMDGEDGREEAQLKIFCKMDENGARACLIATGLHVLFSC